MAFKLPKNPFCFYLKFLLIPLILAGSFVRLLDHFELDTLDWRFRLRPGIETDGRIALIEIGDDTIERLGAFPLARDYHAVLIDALAENGAKAVIFDIFFPEEKKGDDAFQEAMTRAGNVYLPFVLDLASSPAGRLPRAEGFRSRNILPLSLAARGTGHINVIPDIDGKFRRVPLLIRHEDKLIPYLSFLVGRDILGIGEGDIRFKPGRHIRFGDHVRIPLDERSHMLINYPGKWGSFFRHYSYVDVLQSHFAGLSGEEPHIDLGLFKDKICLVGLTATGTSDLHPNPFEALYPAVGIHANVINAVLTRNFLSRAPRWLNLLIVLALVYFISIAACRAKPLKGFLILLGAAVWLAAAGYVVFLLGTWIDLVYPLTAMLSVYLYCILCKYISEWRSRLVMENELKIAKQIQESFLPKSLPRTAGLETAAAMFTAKQVGGDLYDFLEFDKNRLGVMIGDVTGKGIPASLFMAMVTGAFKFYAMPDVEPSRTLLNLNQKIIRESSSGLFVTMGYAVLDTGDGTISFASGGHLPILYLPKDGQSRFLEVEDGFPLGLLEGDYSGHRADFQEGDVFVLYTDGVTEAADPEGRMYEAKRLAAAVEKNRRAPARDILSAIETDIRRFEPRERQHDDITVIVVKIVAKPGLNP